MVFFDKLITLRIKKTGWEDIKVAVRENPEVFDSESHFIRSAILEKLREVKG